MLHMMFSGKTMNLHQITEIAKQFGFKVMVFGIDAKEGDFVPVGSRVLVTWRASATEEIAHYVTTSSGHLKTWNGLGANPWHIGLEFKEGYLMRPGHYDEWLFILGGRRAHPEDDPSTPWARFGEARWTREGKRQLHTDFWTRKAAREKEEKERRPEQIRRAQVQEQERIRALPSCGEVRAPRPVPSKPRKAPAKTSKAAALTPAELLCSELRARQGSVLDGAVKVIGPNRFKSYYDQLLSASRAVFSKLGVDESQLRKIIEREVRRSL